MELLLASDVAEEKPRWSGRLALHAEVRHRRLHHDTRQEAPVATGVTCESRLRCGENPSLHRRNQPVLLQSVRVCFISREWSRHVVFPTELVTTPLGGDHMPWNRTTRKDYNRDRRRYESDVTDEEWAIVEPMLPKQGPPGAPARDGLARGLQCHPVCAGHGLPVAGAAEGLSAPFDGRQLFLQMARQWCFRPHDGCAS